MKINLNSSVFTEMNHQLDVAIQAVLREVYKKNFQSGDITLKLIIGSHTDFAQVPDGMGGVTNAPYEKPSSLLIGSLSVSALSATIATSLGLHFAK